METAKVIDIIDNADEYPVDVDYYALIEQGNRRASRYLDCNLDDKIYDDKAYKEIAEMLAKQNRLDISSLPRIEDASDALQACYDAIYVVDNFSTLYQPILETAEAKAKFDAELNADIAKYKLGNTITKVDDAPTYSISFDFTTFFSADKDFFSQTFINSIIK